MKKIVLLIFFTALIFFSFSLYSFAVDEISDDYVSDSGAYEVFDNIDESTKDILSDLGIEEFNTEQVFKISPKRIISEIIKIISNKIISPVKLCLTLITVLIIQSAVKSFSNDENKSVSDIVFILLLSTAAAVPAYNSITLAASHLLTVSNFMISFVPVYAVLLSSSGNFSQALNFNSLLFAASELIVSFSENYILPITGIMMSLNIASSVNPVLKLDSLIGIIKKAVTIILTFISTLFIGFLSLKGSIASSVDALTVRSIRTVSGSVIPFIGSSLADAYSSVLGSLKLINNCFGFLGILVLCAINLPVIIELLLYYFSFKIASMVGEILNCEQSKILDGIAGIVSITNITVVFVSVIFTVSTGLMLKTRVV